MSGPLAGSPNVDDGAGAGLPKVGPGAGLGSRNCAPAGGGATATISTTASRPHFSVTGLKADQSIFAAKSPGWAPARSVSSVCTKAPD